jgi:hypothetical protein
MNQLELRDIHLPEASLWWPPAPGWWLGLLLIAVLAILLPHLLRWYRRKPLRRVSLLELARIRRLYRQGGNERDVLNEVVRLLRRVTISYYGRNTAAAATGDEWLRQLQLLSTDSGFSAQQLELLVRERYRAQCEFDIEQLLQGCERWLRALPRGCHHV